MSVLPRRRRGAAAVALLAAGLLAATTACGGGGSDGKGGTTGTARNTGKVTLTFWDWDPNIDKVVAKWNSVVNTRLKS